MAYTRRVARRAAAAVCTLALLWAAGVAITGGFATRLGGVRLSSRDPVAAAVVALISALLFGALLFGRDARHTLREDFEWFARLLGRARRRLGPLGVLATPAIFLALVGTIVDVVQWTRGAPLWADEEMIALNLRDRSFADLAGTLWLGQSAPLGWLVLERSVLLLVGRGELALRFMPFLAGLATVWAAVWIGRRWLTGAGATLLVAICWIAEWLSHFRFELKHYSADAFFALIIPALAVRAVEENAIARRPQRWLAWWIVAAAGQLFSNGALFVTPACALLFGAVVLYRYGLRSLMQFAAGGIVWLAAFAVHYDVSLQYTHHNRFLRDYWLIVMPPDGVGAIAMFGWITRRLIAIGENPGAVTAGATLWLTAGAGFALARPRTLGWMFASVPVSAMLLAAMRLVPLYERFSLWIVPALYLGLALLFDAGLRRAQDAWHSRARAPLALATLASVMAALLGVDIIVRGQQALDVGAPHDSNHGLDDRGAVRWLMQRQAPGDAVITTRLGWPAVWWYGDLSLSPIVYTRPPSGHPVMYQISHDEQGRDCAAWSAFFAAHERALVYIGFPDMPNGFFELLLDELAPHAIVVETRRFDQGRALVAQRSATKNKGAAPERMAFGELARPLDGCVRLGMARRW